MGIQQQIGITPMPAVAHILSRFDRQQLEAFVTVAIDLMDVADGDPDQEMEDPASETVPVIDDPERDVLIEDDGDPDLEETDVEDSFLLSRQAAGSGSGAGCVISDAGGGAADDEGEPDDDAQGDTSWTEWHTRGRFKDDPGIYSKSGYQLLEDVEDDDPAEANGDETDGVGAEDEECAYFALTGSGPGCVISDPDKAVDDDGCDHFGMEGL